jgi:hypothetical protein
VLVSACLLGRRKEWRILRILAAMSTSFSLNPAGSGQTWWSRSFEELGSDLTGFTALRQPISSIKSNAWLSSPLPPETLSRRQRMRTLRIRCPLGKCCLSLFVHSVKTRAGKNDNARAGRAFQRYKAIRVSQA